MKRFFFTALVAVFMVGALAAQQTARVQKVDGFDIYILATPSGPYEELYPVSGFWNFRELFGGATLDNMVSTMVRNAKKKAKNKPGATGIIFTSKSKGVAIKIKNG